MKLYLIWQRVNTGYDTYDSAVVCAPNPQAAKKIHPNGSRNTPEEVPWPRMSDTWCKPKEVCLKYLGEAAPHIQ